MVRAEGSRARVKARVAQTNRATTMNLAALHFNW